MALSENTTLAFVWVSLGTMGAWALWMAFTTGP